MKLKIASIITLAVVLTGCSASSSIARKEKAAADFRITADLVESGNYQFTIRSATASGGKSIQLTSLYTMEVSDAGYEAKLPYFGRAYSASYGGDGGIEFNGKPENLKVTRDDQLNSISVAYTIEASKNSDKYDVKLKIGATGYGNLVISSRNRQSISYYGIVGELKD
jgi:Domain of unknown function (DUF4251)